MRLIPRVGCSRRALVVPRFAPLFKNVSLLAWFCVLLLLSALPLSSSTNFATAFSVNNNISSDSNSNTHMNSGATGVEDDDEWAAVPQKKLKKLKKLKNRDRRRPPHDKKPQKGDDEFPSFLASIPSYIHPPPPPLLPPSLATLRIATTDNDEAEGGDALGSEEAVASTDDPVLILLVGFPGSGKSTWSRKLQQVMPWKYERVNQDELKTRSQCLSKAQQVLWTEKKCAIVDRCHVSREQRAYFVKLAQSSNVNSRKSRDVDFATATTTSTTTTTTTPLSKIPVDCIFFDVSKDTCLARCRQRRNHPTLPASKAAFVLNAMEKELEIPTIREGFRNIHRIQDEHTFLQVLNTYLSMPSSLQSS